HRAALLNDPALVGHEIDDGVRRVGDELGGVRAVHAADVSGELDDRALHAEADPEERDLALSRVAGGLDLSFRAAIAEATRDEDRVERRQRLFNALREQALRVDVFEIEADVVLEAAVDERLVERLVRVLQVDVLADDADPYAAALRLREALDDAL